MARKKKQSYEEFLQKATYQELEIQINYWCDLIDRYAFLEDYIQLTEAEQKLGLVKQYRTKYEENFLDKFKQECPYMAHAVNLIMAKDYLQKYAANNILFKPSADLFKDYLLSNEIIKMEDIEL